MNAEEFKNKIQDAKDLYASKKIRLDDKILCRALGVEYTDFQNWKNGRRKKPIPDLPATQLIKILNEEIDPRVEYTPEPKNIKKSSEVRDLIAINKVLSETNKNLTATNKDLISLLMDSNKRCKNLELEIERLRTLQG